jgi:hypothetical protein
MTSTTQGAPVFDLLTLDDLYELHTRLCAQEREIHARLMDGLTPLISPLSDEWNLQAARCREIAETADAAYAEIQRREDEALDRFPLTGVPMVCTRCRQLVEPVPGQQPTMWTHQAVDYTGPGCVPAAQVKAMVAEGNASVPRA